MFVYKENNAKGKKRKKNLDIRISPGGSIYLSMRADLVRGERRGKMSYCKNNYHVAVDMEFLYDT